MTNAARILISLIAFLFLGYSSHQSAPTAETVMVDAYSAEQEELITFATGRFDQAGLSLPAVTIVFPENRNDCYGFGGVYEPEMAQVSICRPSETTMVHELAHAWAESTLTASARQEFLDMRGLDGWTAGPDWDERGAEHAAEILTWAVMDRDISIDWIETDFQGNSTYTRRLFKIPNSSPEQLSEAFTQLTGLVAEDRVAENQAAAVPVAQMVANPEAIRFGG